MSQPTKNPWNQCAGNSAASTYGKHNSCNERKPLEVVRGNVQKQAKVANIIARHWQRKRHNTQAFKPAVCQLQDAPSGNLSRCVPPPGCKTHPPGVEPGSIGAKSIQYHYARGACPKWQKWLYRTTDWVWKGFAGIKNTMRNTPLTPQPNPQPNPQTTPPINETPPNNPPQPNPAHERLLQR